MSVHNIAGSQLQSGVAAQSSGRPQVLHRMPNRGERLPSVGRAQQLTPAAFSLAVPGVCICASVIVLRTFLVCFCENLGCLISNL